MRADGVKGKHFAVSELKNFLDMSDGGNECIVSNLIDCLEWVVVASS